MYYCLLLNFVHLGILLESVLTVNSMKMQLLKIIEAANAMQSRDILWVLSVASAVVEENERTLRVSGSNSEIVSLLVMVSEC